MVRGLESSLNLRTQGPSDSRTLTGFPLIALGAMTIQRAAGARIHRLRPAGSLHQLTKSRIHQLNRRRHA